MFQLVIFICAAVFINQVAPHGYMINGRVASCLDGPNTPFDFPGLFWRPGGVDIRDQACRTAGQYTYNKYLDNGPDYAQDAMVYPFVQIAEFAGNNVNYRFGPQTIREVTGNNHVCSGGATVNSIRPYGDKSGFDMVAPWRKSVISANVGVNIANYEFVFCVTVPHAPGKWWVWQTVDGFDPHVERLTWDVLELVAEYPDIPLEHVAERPPYCRTNMVYRVPTTVQVNPTGTYVVVWQRIDPAGEFFIQCVDYQRARPFNGTTYNQYGVDVNQPDY